MVRSGQGPDAPGCRASCSGGQLRVTAAGFRSGPASSPGRGRGPPRALAPRRAWPGLWRSLKPPRAAGLFEWARPRACLHGRGRSGAGRDPARARAQARALARSPGTLRPAVAVPAKVREPRAGAPRRGQRELADKAGGPAGRRRRRGIRFLCQCGHCQSRWQSPEWQCARGHPRAAGGFCGSASPVSWLRLKGADWPAFAGDHTSRGPDSARVNRGRMPLG